MTMEDFAHWQIYDHTGQRKYLTGDELKRFLRVADWREPSTRALCHMLAYTGCRISEALSLTRPQFDAETMTVTLKTLKRRRVVFRVLHIPEQLAGQLCQLPTQADGRFWTMHRATAWRALKEIMTLAGIMGPMASPKGLRHGFGIRAAARKIPPNLIQRWMGHSSIETTMIYLDACGSEEREFASRMW